MDTTAGNPPVNAGAAYAGVAPVRPHLDERADYRPRSSQEAFIVPLLAKAIGRELPACVGTAAPGERGLDVGCGRQPFRGDIERAGLRYVGLDTQQNADCPVDVVWPIDDRGSLPAELRSLVPFRFILCTEVLEHVADWDAAFANFARLLAPGGRVLITCPHSYPLHEVPYDFWRATPHAIEFFARRHGLRIIRVERLGDAWDVVGTLLSSVTARAARGGPSAWVAVRVFKLLRRLLLGSLLGGPTRRLVRLEGDVYQSNLAVLEKP